MPYGPASRNRSSSTPKSRGAARLLRGLSIAGSSLGSVSMDGIEKARKNANEAPGSEANEKMLDAEAPASGKIC